MHNDRISIKKIYLITAISLLGVFILIVGFFFGVKLYFKDEIAYYEQKCLEYAEENADLDCGDVVFIGDSIVELYPLDSHFNSTDVFNRGIKNDMTLGVKNRLQTSLVIQNPSNVIIMVGANDIKYFRSVNAIVETYKEIVYAIFDGVPTTNIYVMSVIPQNKDYEKIASVNVDKNMKKIKELNAKLEEFCNTCSAIYVNLFDLLVDEDGYLDKAYSDDGFHLNETGYTVWTTLLKDKNILS